jgi:hypothetical protein
MVREANRHAYHVGCSSQAKLPSLDEQRAAQLALSSPLGKEDRGRNRGQRSREGGCHTCRTRCSLGRRALMAAGAGASGELGWERNPVR